MKICVHIITIVSLLLVVVSAKAQTFDERMDDWPLDLKINGTIMACPDSDIDEEQLEYFLRIAGGENARIVSIGLDEAFRETTIDQWSQVAEVSHFQLNELSEASDSASDSVIDSDLQNALSKATGLWMSSPDALTREEVEIVRRMAPELTGLIERRGALFTSGAVTRMLGKYWIVGGQLFGNARQASVVPGLHLLPDVVLQTGYDKNWANPQLMSVLGAHPRCVGIGMDPAATLVLRGRKIQAYGSGKLHFLVMANERSPLRRKTIAAPPSRRTNPYESLVDLTAWRRDAIDRTIEVFPAAEPETPFVENGTLMIVGGGGMPEGLMDQFVDLAGGENARLVYIPCTEREEVNTRDSRLVNAWKARGVASAHVVHTKDRIKANSDSDFLEPLKNATGIFFGGGRQWNFADSYYGTEAHRLMKDVLKRGGVIAGSSAGASIQGRYLARANPLGNIDIMAAGYERGGLGFISGVAIDQHFTQRGRQRDMTGLVNRYPQILGIGIDETTAIIVRESVAEVVGRGDVYFYDRNQHAAHEDPDHLAIGAGKKYDLAKRKVVEE